MQSNRRGFIFGAAGLGMAVPTLVKAESLLEIPGDPLTRHGMFAASKWATDSFRVLPAVRLAFANGEATRWAQYDRLSRPALGEAYGSSRRNYAVAIEVSATDANGKRFVTSVPIDAVMVEQAVAKQLEAERRQVAETEQKRAERKALLAKMYG